ncbi:alpha/beta hydrolase [Streptomyces ferrugineus]|uniref:Alpha/beta hydrolase n=1 Tax=Streptomyces ferrugineus TaxID=1413221 RepID=A0A7M2SHF8_9ACTN|nr:alpha/beta hydrolase [Streptomyces ferrugineus]QOV35722.1 alpha/beta hydrolase [Streptomyces ferrugineus]
MADTAAKQAAAKKEKKNKKDKFEHLNVEEGTLRHGLPYRALGTGDEPLVVLRWFTDNHTNPEGWERGVELKQLAPLAERYRVYAVNRAPGMARGTTMEQVAEQHAQALTEKFGGPVHILGTSSGGSVAMQLAADHPQVFKRMVLAMAGHTMGDEARQAQLKYAEASEAGRRALHHTARISFKSAALAKVVAPLMWLVDPFVRPKDPSDMVAFVRAEAAFDVRDRLAEIRVPTLVIAGGADRACPPEVCRRTVEGMPDAELVVYDKAGHIGTFNNPRFPKDVLAFLDTGSPVRG